MSERQRANQGTGAREAGSGGAGQSASGAGPMSVVPAILPSVLEPTSLSLADKYVRVLLGSGRLDAEDDLAAVASYGDPLADALTWDRTPRVQGVVGRDLFPSYGYLRVYWEGAVLPVHQDRVGCDWTLSVCVAVEEGASDWPLSVEASNGVLEEYSVAPGDGALLAGRVQRHGRPRAAEGWSAWLFLHWVEEGSAYLDGRVGFRKPGPVAS